MPSTSQRQARSPRRDRGIATVLILVLVGLSLSAAVLGTAHYIQGRQAQSVSTHAQTQAQMKAWSGVALLTQYLQALQTQQQLSSLLAMPVPVTLDLAGTGISNQVKATITGINTTDKTLTAQVVGITAPGTRAEASAVVEAVFSLAGSGTNTPAICSTTPGGKSVRFNGDVSITGGQTSVTSVSGYTDIAVNGSLTISNASEAIISGCTKGDITLSGGGIDANATLTSENGTIKITSMSTPTDATLWGKNVDIGNTGSGSYIALKAGAYATRVTSQGVGVGTANVGGQLLPGTTGAAVPWTTGTVVPWGLQPKVALTTRASGSPVAIEKSPAEVFSPHVVVTGSSGAQWLLDLRKASINKSTGVVTGATAASELLAGSGTLPDTLEFTAQSISGGALDIYNLTVKELSWGHTSAMKGYGGTYGTVFANGDFKVVTAVISQFLGGGFTWATEGGCSSSTNCWNFPTITSGKTATTIFYASGKTALPGAYGGLQAQQTGTSPGLPGVPFCDTRTNTIDVADYRSQANYVFHFSDSGKPLLTIQNVKTKAGASIDKASIDLSTVDSPMPVDNPTLRQIGGKDFLACSNQAASNKSKDALACLRNASTSTGWNLAGITKFPPGVALFYGPVKIDGVASSTQATLYNTVLATGAVNLTSAGHVPLVAPNFASSVAAVCDGDFYPSNLCNKGSSPSTLATWTDTAGTSHAGLPIANLAVATNGALTASGWDITGNVIVGGTLDTAGATTSVNGSLAVGSNQVSKTSITAGGVKVNTTKLSIDQSQLPGVCTGSSSNTPGTVSLLWSRYL